MSSSRAQIAVRDGRITRAFAGSPQRWNRTVEAADGFMEVIHQVVGDGLFAGEVHRAVVDVVGPATVVVRGITATPLRRGMGGAILTRLRVRAGATLVYLPGALLPHEGSSTTHSLTAEIERGGALLMASVVLPGRTARGEFARFERLRLRTVVRAAGEMVFGEDAEVRPPGWQLAGPGGFAGGEAALTVIAVGTMAATDVQWWRSFEDCDGVVWGVSALAAGGVIVRGIAATLGDAQRFLEGVERRVRACT